MVVPNPVRLERFARGRPAGGRARRRCSCSGRIAVRKGVEDVVAVARMLPSAAATCASASWAGPSLWSDYTQLLEDLPPENAEYVGRVPAGGGRARARRAATCCCRPSQYEPFALTVAEALAAGVPVVATSEVGAIEGVDRSVAAEVPAGRRGGDGRGDRRECSRGCGADPPLIRALARAEAERLFAPEVVCGRRVAPARPLAAARRLHVRHGRHRHRDGPPSAAARLGGGAARAASGLPARRRGSARGAAAGCLRRSPRHAPADTACAALELDDPLARAPAHGPGPTSTGRSGSLIATKAMSNWRTTLSR